ncbi:MAG: 4-oxalocrotonate tautomerase [Enterovirga sp.]|jgi:4-oxalocrotonate tautomerase|nr:4-oxalocrotonate tautomerase [Enterovirga sp.]
MPMIRVEMFPGRTAEQKRDFAKAVTDSFVAICGGTPQSVQIVFTDVQKGDWATAGKLASDAAAPAAAAPAVKTA